MNTASLVSTTFVSASLAVDRTHLITSFAIKATSPVPCLFSNVDCKQWTGLSKNSFLHILPGNLANLSTSPHNSKAPFGEPGVKGFWVYLGAGGFLAFGRIGAIGRAECSKEWTWLYDPYPCVMNIQCWPRFSRIPGSPPQNPACENAWRGFENGLLSKCG